MTEKPYPNDLLTDICKELLDLLTPEQIACFAADIVGECENIVQDRNEAASQMSDLPKIHLCSTRYRDGNVEHTLLIDGKYYRANEWEYQCIKQGRSPEELGMTSWTDEDLEKDYE